MTLRDTILRQRVAYHLAGISLLIASASAAAQQASPSTETPASAPQRVEIMGAPGAANERRHSTATKIVVTREEIARYGDASLAGVLARVPGLSVTGTASSGFDIRMRGLGSGYTQLLLDGEPVAAGFSLASINPASVERIEIYRSPTAELGSQSIAGTVNIVLRRSATAGTSSSMVRAGGYDRGSSTVLSHERSFRDQQRTITLVGAVGLESDHWPSTVEQRAFDGTGAPLYSRSTDVLDKGRQLTIDFRPRVNWNSGPAGTFSIEGFFQVQRFKLDNHEKTLTSFGSPPDYPQAGLQLQTDWKRARVSLNRKQPVGAVARLEMSGTASSEDRYSGYDLRGADSGGDSLLLRTTRTLTRDASLILKGKYALTLGNDHALGLGWDGQFGRRTERKTQQESSPVGLPTLDLDELFTAEVTRLALFAQDEWQLSSTLSAYLGLRWEGLKTRTRGSQIDAVHGQFDVLSPSAQVLWKLSDAKDDESVDQVRVALARTYKAPSARDLVPRTWRVGNNAATNPDFQGNPELKPELSWGLDVSYEHHLAEEGMLGVNAYLRRIRDVRLTRVLLVGTNWIERPENVGDARVAGLELEARFNLKALQPGAPNLDLRASLGRNVSRVDGVPGPGNRLAAQPTLSAGLGFDWRPAGTSWAVGSSFAYERGGLSHTSEARSITTPAKRTLDGYLAWRIDPSRRLRFTFRNLLAPDELTGSRYADSTFVLGQSGTVRTVRSASMQFELRR